MGITFEVSRVARAEAPLRIPAQTGSLLLQGRPVEAMGASASPFVSSQQNALLRAVHTAYALHYPLALSPDAIWLAIAQGFSQHVNANAERFRDRFVSHRGQPIIRIVRDDFVRGSRDNPWPEVFGSFSDAIAGHIGKQRDLVVCDFSTTGPCERAASEIVLMDAMKAYFRYEVFTRCGIPEITLEGRPDDWRSVRRRAQALGEYELTWWTKALIPVLDKLVETAGGKVDVPFWEKLFKHADGSGGPWVLGWINTLFPYLKQGKQGTLAPNRMVSKWSSGFDAVHGGGAKPEEVPSGLTAVPFVWDYLGTRFDMEFLGGFVGVAQDRDTLAVRPAIGWAVRDAAPAAPAVGADLLEDAPECDEEAGEERLERELFWVREYSAVLITGRLSRATPLVGDEIASVVGGIREIASRAGLAISCVPVTDFMSIVEFPEAPVSCRFAVGVEVLKGDFNFGSRPVEGSAVLGALEIAQRISKDIWSAIEALVPGGLSGAQELLLVATDPRVDAVLSPDAGLGAPIAEVKGFEKPYSAAAPSRLAKGDVVLKVSWHRG